MELDPIQQQQLETFQSNFEGSQEEYDRQLKALYDQFNKENEQKELAKRECISSFQKNLTILMVSRI